MTDRIGPDELARQFPIVQRVLHANHASVSPWPLVAVQAVKNFAERSHREGLLAYPAWMENETRLRQRAARMLNAGSAADISLLSNTTAGIGIVANGLDWRPGDNVVTAVGEFPTNRLAWEALAERGVELRPVDLRAVEEPEQALLAAMDRRTRLLAVSSVQYTDGLRLDLERLGAGCRNAGVCFFVDAIQQLGALRIDVQAAAIDALSAGSHKWQLGPEGMAVFYCSPALRPAIKPAQWGWRMLERPFDFEDDRQPLARDGRRFEPGTPNRIGEVALDASLALLESAGLERVESDILANTAQLIGGITSIPGLAVISDTRPGRRSGIITFSTGKIPPAAFVRALKDRGVVAIARAGGVRLSPHFYQTGVQIDALLEAVEAVSKQ